MNKPVKCPDCGRNIAKPAGQIDTCEVKCSCDRNKKKYNFMDDNDIIFPIDKKHNIKTKKMKKRRVKGNVEII
jgi:hypothetical protein